MYLELTNNCEKLPSSVLSLKSYITFVSKSFRHWKRQNARQFFEMFFFRVENVYKKCHRIPRILAQHVKKILLKENQCYKPQSRHRINDGSILGEPCYEWNWISMRWARQQSSRVVTECNMRRWLLNKRRNLKDSAMTIVITNNDRCETNLIKSCQKDQ
jgi:hypothetical protein